MATPSPSEADDVGSRAIGDGRQAIHVKVESLDHIHIYAAEPEKSAEFYSLHFEAKPITRNTNVNGDTRIFLAIGGQIVVIGSFPNGLAPASPPDAGDGALLKVSVIFQTPISHFKLQYSFVRRV